MALAAFDNAGRRDGLRLAERRHFLRRASAWLCAGCVAMRMTRSAMTPCASQPSLAVCIDSANQSFHICIGFDICFS
jgi:hypothetical protein